MEHLEVTFPVIADIKMDVAKKRLEKPAPDTTVLDWFMVLRRLPKDELKLSDGALRIA